VAAREPRTGLSSIKRPRTADEPIAPNVESQRIVGCARNANSIALPDFAGPLTVRSKQQRAGLTEVDPVQPAINPQGFAQPSGTPRQVSHTLDAAIPLHDRDADGWLDRPDQHARAHPGCLARDVQHERDAIGEINICVPAFEEKRPIAWGDAAVGVTRGVPDAVCLGLDDAAARHAFGQCPHEHFADEKASELSGIGGQLCPVQHAWASQCRPDFTPFAQRNALSDGPGSKGSGIAVTLRCIFAPIATQFIANVYPKHAGERINTISEKVSSMAQVQVEQESYQMPPQDGFTVAHFLTVADIERSARFYETVFGGRILSGGDAKGAPGYIQIANTWLIVNVGGGPTPDKPSVTLSVPADPDSVSSFMNIRVADIQACYELWRSRGAEFITEPKDKYGETRCYIRDPDGYIIEIGQSKPDFTYG